MIEELEKILITLTWCPDTTVESKRLISKAETNGLGRDMYDFIIVSGWGDDSIKITMRYLQALEKKYDCNISFIVGG